MVPVGLVAPIQNRGSRHPTATGLFVRLLFKDMAELTISLGALLNCQYDWTALSPAYIIKTGLRDGVVMSVSEESSGVQFTGLLLKDALVFPLDTMDQSNPHRPSHIDRFTVPQLAKFLKK